VAPFLGVQPQQYQAAAGVAAMADAATAAPPTGIIEIERIAPAWCAGYLEEQTAAELTANGVKAYLSTWWGGGRYRLTPKDTTSAPQWTGPIYAIAGPSKHQGQEIAPPAVLQPAAPPAAAPQASPTDPAILAVLQRQAELLEQLAADRARTTPAAPTPSSAEQPPAARGDLAGLLREHAKTSRDLRDALEEISPGSDRPASDAPQDEAEKLATEAMRRGLDRFLPPMKAQGTQHTAQGETARKAGPRAVAEKIS